MPALNGLKKSLKSKAFTAFYIGVLLFIFFSMFEIPKYGGLVLYSSDYTYMAMPNFVHTRDAIISGNTNWDWASGLGSQFLGSYIAQQLSPFYIFILLVPRKFLLYALPYITALKYGTGAMFAYFYIRRFVKNEHLAVIGGLLYMFSSFTAYTVIFNFVDVIMIFPLLLLSLDELCLNGRRGVFALSVALMGFQSVYFLFGQAVFCVIYYFIRCTDKSYKASVKQFLALAAEAVIGFGISLVISLPCILYMLDMPRTTSTLPINEMFLYHDAFHYLKIIQSAFMIPDPMNYTSMFPETEAMYPYGHAFSCAAALIPLFGSAGVISWIWARRKSWQTKVLVICVIMALVPVLNSLFSALNTAYYARWFYMPLLLGTAVSVKAMEEEISFKPGFVVCGSFSALFLIYHIFFASYGFALVSEDGDDSTLDTGIDRLVSANGIQILLMILIPVIFMLALFTLLRAKNEKKYVMKLYSISIAAIIATYGLYAYYYSNPPINFNYLTFASDLYKTLTSTEEDYGGDRISTECRSAFADAFMMTRGAENVQRAWNMQDRGNIEFIDSLGHFYDKGNHLFDVFESNVPADLMSVKTYVTLGRSLQSYYEYDPTRVIGVYNGEDFEMPEQEDYNERFNIAEPVEVREFIFTQENLNYIPMGFTYDKMISKERFLQIEDVHQRMDVMMRSVVVEDPSLFSDILIQADDEADTEVTREEYRQLIERHRSECCDHVDRTTEGFTAHIDLEKENLVFFSASWNGSWTAEIDGEKTDYYNVNCGLIGIRVPAGSHDIKFVYTTPGLKSGGICSVISIAALAAYLIAAGLLAKKKTADTTDTEGGQA